MYCLDTNIIIDFLRGEPAVIKKIQSMKSKNAGLFINTVVLCELYKGAYLAKANIENILSKIKFLTESLDSLDFNTNASLLFGKEYGRLSKLGKTPQELDLMIASIAKAHNMILITRDKNDFKNIDVKIEVW
ncbi:MAG: type II toxin-antitoxin system VapC family toxin [Nanoarchaeota archaeon]|nr:type II toxin-antitoxin system VapC family toxin [Nanoarchaeota archaeon]